MLLSFMLLAVVVNGVRDCAPVAKLLPSVLTWHLVVFAFNAFWMIPFYGEGSDALVYHNLGTDVANTIRDGAWGNIEWGLNTTAIPIIVGFLYAPFGANVYGSLFFFGGAGSRGLYLFLPGVPPLGFPGADPKILHNCPVHALHFDVDRHFR